MHKKDTSKEFFTSEEPTVSHTKSKLGSTTWAISYAAAAMSLGYVAINTIVNTDKEFKEISSLANTTLENLSSANTSKELFADVCNNLEILYIDYASIDDVTLSDDVHLLQAVVADNLQGTSAQKEIFTQTAQHINNFVDTKHTDSWIDSGFGVAGLLVAGFFVYKMSRSVKNLFNPAGKSKGFLYNVGL